MRFRVAECEHKQRGDEEKNEHTADFPEEQSVLVIAGLLRLSGLRFAGNLAHGCHKRLVIHAGEIRSLYTTDIGGTGVFSWTIA